MLGLQGKDFVVRLPAFTFLVVTLSHPTTSSSASSPSIFSPQGPGCCWSVPLVYFRSSLLPPLLLDVFANTVSSSHTYMYCWQLSLSHTVPPSQPCQALRYHVDINAAVTQPRASPKSMPISHPVFPLSPPHLSLLRGPCSLAGEAEMPSARWDSTAPSVAGIPRAPHHPVAAFPIVFFLVMEKSK
jgi:hypothetical protein